MAINIEIKKLLDKQLASIIVGTGDITKIPIGSDLGLAIITKVVEEYVKLKDKV